MAIVATNVRFPVRRNKTLAFMSFFWGWLTGELALHFALATCCVSAFSFLYLEANAYVYAGHALSAFALLLFAIHTREGLQVRPQIEAALRSLHPLDPVAHSAPRVERLLAGHWDLQALLMPFYNPLPEVLCERDIVFWRNETQQLQLDMYRAPSVTRYRGKAPVLLVIHGGAWVLGFKQYQGLRLMRMLASRGWIVVNIDYRLSPQATFPAHIIDVKRAIAWVREHIASYGGDATQLYLSGNSAGAHLASLAALSPQAADFQPDFPNTDTRIQGCVLWYGVYDFLDRKQHFTNQGCQQLLEKHVLKTDIKNNPACFQQASPIDWLGHAPAPPMLIYQGTHDTLVPCGQAQQFVHAIRQQSSAARVHYIEIPGAQHVFDLFPSIRSEGAVYGAIRFLEDCVERNRAPSPPTPSHKEPQAP